MQEIQHAPEFKKVLELSRLMHKMDFWNRWCLTSVCIEVIFMIGGWSMTGIAANVIHTLFWCAFFSWVYGSINFWHAYILRKKL